MKITMIHGQNHEGSTCMVARELAEKVGGQVQEFFLPQDFDHPCCGCYSCFKTDLTHCPHYKDLAPLEKAILDADLLILDSPVYVCHASGQMMSFLDHFGTWWMVHRPRPEMSGKQAVAICTAAGGGMKSTTKDMADSLEMWGIRKVYRLDLGVQAIKPAEIPLRIQASIHRKTSRLARQIRENTGKTGCNVRARKWFYLMRFAHRNEVRFSNFFRKTDFSFLEGRLNFQLHRKSSACRTKNDLAHLQIFSEKVQTGLDKSDTGRYYMHG